MRSATLQELLDTFNRDAAAVQTLSLKLVLTARAGRHKYPGVNSYLLTQRPNDIRIWGTFTLLGRLFDMASNGSEFELSLPTSNQFITGGNDVIPALVKNPLETLRPQIIRNALLINTIAPDERAALDPSAPENQYVVLILARASDGTDRLARRITFSRYDLLPHAQVIYDASNPSHATHATYDRYTLADSIPVPMLMTIARPAEGYSLKLEVARGGIVFNHPFPPGTFQLRPPAGSTVIHLSQPSAQN